MSRTRGNARIAALVAAALFAAALVPSSTSAAAITAARYQATTTGTLKPYFNYTSLTHTVSCKEGLGFTGPALTQAAGSITSSGIKDGKNCSGWYEGYQPVLEMNGCQITFDPTAKSGEDYAGKFSVGPPSCGPIVFNLGSCTDTIETASWGKGAYVRLRDLGNEIELEVSDVVNVTQKGPLCGSSQPTIEAAWTLSALDELEEVDPLGLAPAGVRIGGEGGGKPQPQFESDLYPNELTSANGAAFSFSTPGQTFSCSETSMAGPIVKATAQLALSPAYGKCTAKIGSTTVPAAATMNGCSHTVTLRNLGPPYQGNFGIACEGAGPIEYKVYSNEAMTTVICTYKVGVQESSGGVNLANVAAEEGKESAIEASVAAEGISYERKGILCGGTKSASDGKITYGTTLQGL